jgi:hypothetical protein
MSLNMTLTASFLPVLLELAAVIRKKGTMKPLLLPQRDPRLSHRQLVGQTAQHKPIYHFQRAGLLKRRAEKLNNLLHTHSIFRWLDLLNKRTANCLNKRIRFQTGSIVSTIAVRLVATKKSILSCFSVYRDSLTPSPDKLPFAPRIKGVTLQS